LQQQKLQSTALNGMVNIALCHCAACCWCNRILVAFQLSWCHISNGCQNTVAIIIHQYASVAALVLLAPFDCCLLKNFNPNIIGAPWPWNAAMPKSPHLDDAVSKALHHCTAYLCSLMPSFTAWTQLLLPKAMEALCSCCLFAGHQWVVGCWYSNFNFFWHCCPSLGSSIYYAMPKLLERAVVSILLSNQWIIIITTIIRMCHTVAFDPATALNACLLCFRLISAIQLLLSCCKALLHVLIRTLKFCHVLLWFCGSGTRTSFLAEHQRLAKPSVILLKGCFWTCLGHVMKTDQYQQQQNLWKYYV